jgi:hypothetical protein
MIALDNMGQMNADTFTRMQDTGMTMYNRLQAAVVEHGGATQDALMPMQDYLHQAEIQAKNLGVPLDANTQMLIDQSKELGVWKEAGKTANQLLLDGISKLNDTMQSLADKIGGIAGSLGNLPSPTVTVTTRYQKVFAPDVHEEGSTSNAAGGGLVTAGGVVASHFAGGSGGVWQPHGSDSVPAMLTPGERVLTVSENNAYERDQRAAASGDPRMLAAIDRLTDAMLGQADVLLMGLRDVLLERG